MTELVKGAVVEKVEAFPVLQRVLVYGSLKMGQILHNYLHGAGFISYTRVKGYLFHLGQYPALVLASKGPFVSGEIYSVSEAQLRTLDRVEGVPHHYARVAIYTVNHGPCWVYVYPFDRVKVSAEWDVVPGGDWKGQKSEHVPFIRYLNDNPQYSVPDKPHGKWDTEYGISVIRQDNVALHDNTPIVIADEVRKRVALIPNANADSPQPGQVWSDYYNCYVDLSVKQREPSNTTSAVVVPEVLPDEPDELYEAFDGVNISWL